MALCRSDGSKYSLEKIVYFTNGRLWGAVKIKKKLKSIWIWMVRCRKTIRIVRAFLTFQPSSLILAFVTQRPVVLHTWALASRNTFFEMMKTQPHHT